MSITLLALATLFAAQDDRARIVDGVESWYMVLQDGKNHGHAFEKLERVKDEWKYRYHADFILDLPDPKDPSRVVDYGEYWDLTATLDEAFQPVALQALLESDGRRVEYSISSEEEKRSLLSGGEPRPLGSDLSAFPNLLFYSLRQGGRLAKTGRQTHRLLAPRAGELVQAEMTFELGDPAETQGVRRTGMANVVRFVKPLPAGRREAERVSARIDKYGRIVELDLRAAKLVLVEGDLEAFRKAVTMHRSSRREPFLKDEAMRAGTTPPPDEPRKPKVTADTMLSTLRDAERLLEALQALKGGDEDELRRAYLRLLDLWKPLRDRAAALDEATVVRRADGIRDRAEEAWDGSARALADARRPYVRLLEAADRADAGAATRELRALKDQRGRIEFERRPEGEELSRWIVAGEAVAARTLTRADLAKRDLLLSGTVISQVEEPVTVEIASGVTQRLRFIRDTSTAVVNGVPCRVGDSVDGLRIEKIQTHSVTVSLRGELREVPLRSR